MKYYEQLSLVARRKRISQNALGVAVGVTRISINCFFRGHTNLRADDYNKLLIVLGINIGSIISEEFNRVTKVEKIVSSSGSDSSSAGTLADL